jgi:dTDP-4-dehydrorhamnose 3,5-epimerase
MRHSTFDIPGPALIIPDRSGDARGYFMEAYKENWFRENIADAHFVQDNQSMSAQAGTIRGLHYQCAPFGQHKLIRCLRGAIYDVVVDIRQGSETFGRWIGTHLTEAGGEQLWVPEGFAHGFCTLEPDTIVFYKVTNYYSREHDKGVAFDDPDIGVDWPIDPASAVLSDKDRVQPKLKDLPR